MGIKLNMLRISTVILSLMLILTTSSCGLFKKRPFNNEKKDPGFEFNSEQRAKISQNQEVY